MSYGAAVLLHIYFVCVPRCVCPGPLQSSWALFELFLGFDVFLFRLLTSLRCRAFLWRIYDYVRKCKNH